MVPTESPIIFKRGANSLQPTARCIGLSDICLDKIFDSYNVIYCGMDGIGVGIAISFDYLLKGRGSMHSPSVAEVFH
jgi:hypothetical protein